MSDDRSDLTSTYKKNIWKGSDDQSDILERINKATRALKPRPTTFRPRCGALGAGQRDKYRINPDLKLVRLLMRRLNLGSSSRGAGVPVVTISQ